MRPAVSKAIEGVDDSGRGVNLRRQEMGIGGGDWSVKITRRIWTPRLSAMLSVHRLDQIDQGKEEESNSAADGDCAGLASSAWHNNRLLKPARTF